MEYIWKDRKRHMGMPLSFTRYAISEDRLFLSEGFFNIKDEEVLLYRIRDISTSRTIWQRIFGMGTITVVSSDKSSPTMHLKNVAHPLHVKELLHEQVEQTKIRRRVRLGEVMTDQGDNDDMPDDDSDLDNEI